MTYNQYMRFWIENKNKITSTRDAFFAIDLALEYYKKNFQKHNEEILKKEDTGEIIQEIK